MCGVRFFLFVVFFKKKKSMAMFTVSVLDEENDNLGLPDVIFDKF